VNGLRVFERQQLALEGLLGQATAKLSEVSRRLTRRSGRLGPWDFSRVRSGMEFPFEDPETLGNVDIHRSLQDTKSMLFTGPSTGWNSEIFRASGSQQSRALFDENLIGGRRSDLRAVFDGAYDLRGFLADFLLATLLVHGRTHVVIHWNETDSNSSIGRMELVERLRTVKIGSNRGRYRLVRRQQHSFPPQEPTVDYINPRDVAVFLLPPPFASRPGRSRLREAHRLARRDRWLTDAQLAYFHAVTITSDRSWCAERARRLNPTLLLDEMKQIDIKIRGILGGLPVLSQSEKTTRYFDAYSALEVYERLASLRESILGQFNKQIVTRLLEKNGLPESSGAIETIGLRSSAEWRRLADQLASGLISYEQLNERMNQPLGDAQGS